MKKAGICGHFAGEEKTASGQVIKTRITAEALKQALGAGQVLTVDSHGGMKAVPRMLLQLWRLFGQCENIIMMPAHKGLRIFTPVCVAYNKIFHRKLHYIVIGGWLDSVLEKHRYLAGMLRGWDAIYVETASMKSALEKRGFHNAVVMPNCKPLQIVKPEQLVYSEKEPYRLCTFSRVMREKGIEDAVWAVGAVNEEAGRTVCTLDIYGKVEPAYEERFAGLQKEFPDYIRYGGLISYAESTQAIQDCFALLFPTRFYTEGVPGTIIDAYAAGVPVIAARWENFADIMEEGKTGTGYDLGDREKLKQVLQSALNHPQKWNAMKRTCLQEAEKYRPEKALTALLQRL